MALTRRYRTRALRIASRAAGIGSTTEGSEIANESGEPVGRR